MLARLCRADARYVSAGGEILSRQFAGDRARFVKSARPLPRSRARDYASRDQSFGGWTASGFLLQFARGFSRVYPVRSEEGIDVGMILKKRVLSRFAVDINMAV